MPKTIKNKFDKCLTFEKIYQAHIRAKKGKGLKKEIILFEMDLENNLIKILEDIKNDVYKFGKYRIFTVYEPKERTIKSLPYRDRIVHQWFVEEFIKPYYCKRFIYHSYACLDNKGTHKSVKELQKMMRKMKFKCNDYYVLKCDIKKYFYSINKQVLVDILSKNITDKKIINFTKVILDDGNKVGIPIGNYTSQYFANIYLNELDRYVKEKLKIKYYIRYMDDFIFLVETKKDAYILLEKIKKFVNDHLKLSLNNKSKYFKASNGIDFCGYKIYETHILLRKRFKNKFNKNIKRWKFLYYDNKLNYSKMILSLNSFKGHAHHANSYNYMIKKISELTKCLK